MTLAILSWGAHRTLINTLTSYKTFGIDQSFKEKLIWFQEITDSDRRVADKFGYQALGSPKNVGIAQAYKYLVNNAHEDTFLFLENDWVALESAERIQKGLELLYSDTVDVVRFRHRRFPGAPLWTLQYRGIEETKYSHLLDSVHWVEYPVRQFPYYIKEESNGFFSTSSHYANWTNNPTMFKTQFLIDHILPRIGTRDIEVDLQSWWEEQDFKVAQDNVGIFTHKRIG